jgi:hypothetical protein
MIFDSAFYREIQKKLVSILLFTFVSSETWYLINYLRPQVPQPEAAPKVSNVVALEHVVSGLQETVFRLTQEVQHLKGETVESMDLNACESFEKDANDILIRLKLRKVCNSLYCDT